MNYNVHIDRQEEKYLFRKFLRENNEKCILLIEAPSGLGKTQLMFEFQRIAQAEGVRHAMLDVSGVGGVVSEFLAAVCEEWPECSFEKFRDRLRAFQQPSADVEVSRVIQIGRPQIYVAIDAPAETTRRERLRQLTEALVKDIRDWVSDGVQAVLLVDTYDPGVVTRGLKQWMEGVFLAHVRRTPGLRVVISGQKVPQRSLMWESACNRLQLEPIDNPEDWMEYVEAEGIKANITVVSAFCHTLMYSTV